MNTIATEALVKWNCCGCVHPVDYRGDTLLATKPAREQWENAFVNTYVAPVLNVCELQY